MASYSFADRPLETGKTGREQFPKKLRDRLIEEAGGCCQICGADHNLQVDHRIPYAVGGEVDTSDQDPFQILCGSCNRTKSWACEHCPNMVAKNPNACRSCYWANQSDYEHVAMRAERRIDLVWIGGEIAAFERLQERARQTGKTASKELKDLLNQANNAP